MDTDARGAMRRDGARRARRRARRSPIVGTAGTTDLGAIDPLDALADRARRARRLVPRRRRGRLRPDALDTLRQRLHGIERADSVTADLHKLWWQPFAASALLVPDVGALRAVHHASVYLNRPEDEAEGQLNLVGRSLDTSRRFDALKVLIALRATGRRRLARWSTTVLDLAEHAGRAVTAQPDLELVAPPSTVMVAFRAPRRRRRQHPRPPRAVRVRRAPCSAARGSNGEVALKLTLLNPLTTPARRRRAARRVVSAAASPAA